MIGQTISHYRIIEKLGEGGMGVVYKAQDTKLDRLVALKFLPSHLSASEQDKARFIQEAKAASAINHPNICTIYSIDEHDGQLFIVMEFVDGQTLRERTKSQSTNLKNAIDIGIQIADGLAAAHEKGIVHRDIKPENIMVRKDGIVQIMDFGLAKLRGVSRLTKEGSTVGTAGYMSPEQVQGQDADHRSDIFSFGVLLYELLTGQLPFRGVHETALAYEIVNVDASPMSALKPDIDPALDAIVLECLEKDSNERTQSARQVAVDLKRFRRESGRQRASRITSAHNVPAVSSISTSSSIHSTGAGIVVQPSSSRQRLPWLLAALFFLVAAVVGWIHFSTPLPSSSLVVRSYIPPPPKTEFNTNVGGHIALSPDGTMLAFVASDSTGKNQLWVRHLKSLVASPLSGTGDASYPFWSYDSRTIAFFAAGKLKRIDAAGGPVLTLCDADGRGGTWNQHGTIVFAKDAQAGLFQVRAEGGTPTELSQLDTTRGELSHRWPHFLPDGDHFLYTTQSSTSGSRENDGMFIGSLSGPTLKRLIVRDPTNMAYASGHLVFIRQGLLMAQRFDPAKLQLLGDAVPIAEGIQFASPRSRGIFSVSRTGLLVYQSAGEAGSELTLLNRRGDRLSTLATRSPASRARFSPDGRKIAFESLDDQGQHSDIWIHDLIRGINTRFTFNRSHNRFPVWSPDGTTIVFSSNRKIAFDLYRKSTTGTAEEAVYESNLNKVATGWSQDGRFVLFNTVGDPKTKADLYVLPMSGDRTPRTFLRTEFLEFVPVFSPDDRWVSYSSDESGRTEVYVQPFEGSGKWQISSNGGSNPNWPAGRSEIIYTAGDRKVTSVEVKASGTTFEVGKATALFDLDALGSGSLHDVTRDGQTFLVSIIPGGSSAPITLVMNWNEELTKK